MARIGIILGSTRPNRSAPPGRARRMRSRCEASSGIKTANGLAVT